MTKRLLLLLKRLEPILIERKLIPDEQFRFCRKHGTLEQVHSVQLSNDLEKKGNCLGAFTVISQAFDEV